MAELETLSVFNPTNEEFPFTFNGERYTPIQAQETKHYPLYLAFFIAKHLSNKMLQKEFDKLNEAAAKAKADPYVPQVSILMNHDNPSRRKFLFDILQDKRRVEDCVKTINLKSFVGEMREYDEYVEKKLAKESGKKSEAVE